MRREFETVLGEELRFLAIETRDRMGLTQREMGERLHMSESSYSDIETGKTKCGTLTSVLLLDMQYNPKDFLKRVEIKFSNLCEMAVQIK